MEPDCRRSARRRDGARALEARRYARKSPAEVDAVDSDRGPRPRELQQARGHHRLVGRSRSSSTSFLDIVDQLQELYAWPAVRSITSTAETTGPAKGPRPASSIAATPSFKRNSNREAAYPPAPRMGLRAVPGPPDISPPETLWALKTDSCRPQPRAMPDWCIAAGSGAIDVTRLQRISPARRRTIIDVLYYGRF